MHVGGFFTYRELESVCRFISMSDQLALHGSLWDGDYDPPGASVVVRDVDGSYRVIYERSTGGYAGIDRSYAAHLARRYDEAHGYEEPHVIYVMPSSMLRAARQHRERVEHTLGGRHG